MRSRSPDLRTLPTRSPTLRVVRSCARLHLVFERECRRSAPPQSPPPCQALSTLASPSLKYSFSLSELMFTKGRTTTWWRPSVAERLLGARIDRLDLPRRRPLPVGWPQRGVTRSRPDANRCSGRLCRQGDHTIKLGGPIAGWRRPWAAGKMVAIVSAFVSPPKGRRPRPFHAGRSRTQTWQRASVGCPHLFGGYRLPYHHDATASPACTSPFVRPDVPWPKLRGRSRELDAAIRVEKMLPV